MDLAFTGEQRRLQRQLRVYFEELVTEIEGSVRDEPTYTHYIRRMGQDGWLGLGWPVEYGGQARGAIDQMIFVEESHWAGVPLPLLTLNSVGPTLMALGTQEQKQRILPGILRGEVHFSIGYTEPSAGTDLASLQTRAVRDGDEYVINGQKIFTSAIQYADFVWLAARTDPEAPKHKGLSVFIVPVDSPGFHWAPLATIVGDITSSTFYEDVRVPAENLVGAENQGWKLITNQLNHERVAICPSSGLLRSLTEVRRWAQAHRLADGRTVMDHEWVQIILARAHAKIEVLKLMNWKVAWASDKGLNPADASATKVYGTELALEVYRQLLEVVGQAGYLAEGSAGAVLRGRLEQQARSQTIFTFGGGTNEIQRDIIAMIGLGMPRARRAEARPHVPELQRLRADHAPAVLPFEMANRAYFARCISDRGDAFFDEFDESFREALAEQESGSCIFHVLVDEDGQVLGRFNLMELTDDGAVLGYRVAEHVAGQGITTATVQELCRRAAVHYGLRSLRAATNLDNVASQRVLTKSGFAPDGPAEPGGRPGTWYRRELSR